jgi:hypothetical protein
MEQGRNLTEEQRCELNSLPEGERVKVLDLCSKDYSFRAAMVAVEEGRPGGARGD